MKIVSGNNCPPLDGAFFRAINLHESLISSVASLAYSPLYPIVVTIFVPKYQ